MESTKYQADWGETEHGTYIMKVIKVVSIPAIESQAQPKQQRTRIKRLVDRRRKTTTTNFFSLDCGGSRQSCRTGKLHTPVTEAWDWLLLTSRNRTKEVRASK